MPVDIALYLTCEGLGDCLYALPVIRKLSIHTAGTYRCQVFTHHPEIFAACPYVVAAHPIDSPELESFQAAKRMIKLFDLKKMPHHAMDTRDFISVPLGIGTLTFAEKELEYFPREPDCAEAFDVLINTSTTWETRTWPLENWQRLADAILARGFSVAVVGKDVWSNADQITKRSFALNGCTDLVNRLSLDQTYFTIGKCGLFITCQNGLSVLAGATDAETMVLGMSIEWSRRAIFRRADPHYKVAYIEGECDIYCAIAGGTCSRKEHSPPRFSCVPSYATVETQVMAKLSALLEQKGERALSVPPEAR